MKAGTKRFAGQIENARLVFPRANDADYRDKGKRFDAMLKYLHRAAELGPDRGEPRFDRQPPQVYTLALTGRVMVTPTGKTMDFG